ncbi:MAG: site-specific DNA-methyltransferase [Bacilli bacterium]
METTNLSKIRREKMLKTINEIKKNIVDEETLNNLSLIENELTKKKYGLIWEEHEERVDKELETQIPVFTEVKEKEIKKGSGKFNFLLEGDNLHSLYLLEKTHRGRIKMIYIDPPYNRGSNDFVYNDNIIGKEDEYKHSKWLSFMYRRLKIADKLLDPKGSAIFISIDENECHNLKILCDEIFGENNYIGDFIRKTKSSTNDADSFFNQQHEYCLIYKKGNFKFKGVYKDLNGYKNPDNDPNGPWKSSDPSAKSGGNSTYFEIKNPITGQIDLPPKGRYWAFSKESMAKYIKSGKIKFKDKIKNNERGFVFKSYANQLKNVMKPIDSLTFVDNGYMNQVATKEINAMNINFDYPKPVNFIKNIIEAVVDENDIVLDFFAGTGTTGEAVQQINKKINYILCTNNENKICENTTYKRIKDTNKNGNIIYYKTAYVPRINTDEENLSKNLMVNIKNLIQLENGIKIDDKIVRVILTEKEIDMFTSNKNELNECEKLYISSDILLTSKQSQIFKDYNIELFIIPEYYFEDEIREVA